MAQYARPDSDLVVNSWTDEGTSFNDGNLYTSIQESSQDGDTSYILSTVGGNNVGTVGLSTVTDPAVHTGHILHVWFRSIGGGGPERLDLVLKQGVAVTIKNLQNQTNRSGSYVDVNYTLTEVEAALITDYSDLRLQIVDENASGEEMRVTCAYLEVPDASNEYYQSAAGVLTPVGSVIKSSGKIVAGITTLTGSISKATTKTFTGSSTLVGVLVKQAQKIFTGASTFVGSLAASKRKLISLIGSLTPSGTLIKSTAKLFVGSVTTTGTLVKQTAKAFVGSVTASGILSTTKVTLLAIGGSITSSGILAKQTVKSFIGATTATGSLIRSTVKAITGSLTPSGILSTTKVTLLAIGGSFTASGILVKQTATTLIGSITAAGSLATQKITVGGEQFFKAVGGVLTMTGSITRRFGRNVSGVLTMAGAVFRHVIGLPTPARQIFSIAAESRIYAIASENRIYSVPRGVRT